MLTFFQKNPEGMKFEDVFFWCNKNFWSKFFIGTLPTESEPEIMIKSHTVPVRRPDSTYTTCF